LVRIANIGFAAEFYLQGNHDLCSLKNVRVIESFDRSSHLES